MPERHACAILFADVVGSTRLYEVLGDERALAVVGDCMAAMRAAVEREGGLVVKTIGDAVMATFEDAGSALVAAMAMRGDIGAMPPLAHGDHPLQARIRAGVHFGQVLHDNGDVFGDAVNVAARMADMAGAGQILTTGDLLDRLAPVLRGLAAEFAVIEVKGRRDPVRVARVADDGAMRDGTVVSPAAGGTRPAGAPPVLELIWQGRALTVDPGSRSLTFGREAGCDVILSGASASRRHATIELRRDKAVLIDHSSNGSWLRLGDDAPIRLLREEVVLLRAGSIAFGADPDGADTVTFRLA